MSNMPRTDYLDPRGDTYDEVVTLAKKLDRELAALTDRIKTVASEAFGPDVYDSAEDAITAIEHGIASQRKLISEYESDTP
jgi:hypothetical protein